MIKFAEIKYILALLVVFLCAFGFVFASSTTPPTLTINSVTVLSNNTAVVDFNVFDSENHGLNAGIQLSSGSAINQDFNYTGGYQYWTVPSGVHSVTITARGASGGYSGGQTPGKGAEMTGTFSVNPGDVLTILAGQSPGDYSGSYSFGGGGGGTFVALGANYATATPLIVAGGGGGTCGGTGIDAPITQNGTGSNPGTNGQGAPAVMCSGGGGGFYSSGGDDTEYPGQAGAGGHGFQLGGAGGATGSNGGFQSGGFGGGSVGDGIGACNSYAGNGGGYSGGSGYPDGSYHCYGQAGGSYNGGTNQTNVAGAISGNGSVTISTIGGPTQGTGTDVNEAITHTPIVNYPLDVAHCTSTVWNVASVDCNMVIDTTAFSGEFYTLVTVTEQGSDGSAFAATQKQKINTPPEVTFNSVTPYLNRAVIDFNVFNVFNVPLDVNIQLLKNSKDLSGYTFTTNYNFSNCGASGSSGPNQGQCDSTYGGTNVSGAVTISGQGIQNWTVPANGVYRITVAGAQGGDYSGNAGGNGAQMQGVFALNQGENILILVGQRGTSQNSGGSSGGGGTFVASGASYSSATPLIVAGGGSGAFNGAGRPGRIETSGGDSLGSGGTDGSGGLCGSNSNSAPGGGGFLGDGQCTSCWSGPNGVGRAFVNGGTGGNAGHLPGGFGGAAEGWNNGSGGAAGGGYSGGGAQQHGSGIAGAGGSYNSGANQNNVAGANSGDGFVEISYGGPLRVQNTVMNEFGTNTPLVNFPLDINHCSSVDWNSNTARCQFVIDTNTYNGDYNASITIREISSGKSGTYTALAQTFNPAPVLTINSVSIDDSNNAVVHFNVSALGGERLVASIQFSLSKSIGSGIDTNEAYTGLPIVNYPLDMVHCASLDWNIAPVDCNFVIDTNAFAGLYYGLVTITSLDTNQLDFNVSALTGINIPPPTTVSNIASNVWQTADKSVKLRCTDSSGPGCATSWFRIDSDPSLGINWGSWQPYHFGGFDDASPSGYVSTQQNVILESTESKVGYGAAQFDSESEWNSGNWYTSRGIDLGTPAATPKLHPTNTSFSISAWVKANPYQMGWEPIAGARSSFWADDGFMLTYGWGPYPVFLVTTPGYGWVACYANPWNSSIVNDTSWHHWVGVYDRPNSILKLFIDGQLVSSSGCNIDVSYYPNSDAFIGGMGDRDQYYKFNGYIDEVSFWDTALSDSDVTTMYNNGSPNELLGTESNLVGLYHLNQDTPINITSDGNYGIQFYSVDIGNREEKPNTQYIVVGPHAQLTTFNAHGLPRSFFTIGDQVTLHADANIPIIPSIVFTQNGTDLNDGVMVNVGQSAPDINGFEYVFTIPSNAVTGWIDVNVGGQEFSKALYVSPVWNNKLQSADANYVFTFDVYISEPNVLPRWFSPEDIPLNFTYNADASSIRVLEFDDVNGSWIEIPSQMHKMGMSGGVVSSGNILFLASIDRNEKRTYAITYDSASHSAPGYSADVVASSGNNTQGYSCNFYENSFFKVCVPPAGNYGSDFGDFINKNVPNDFLGAKNNFPLSNTPIVSTPSNTYYSTSSNFVNYTNEDGTFGSTVVSQGSTDAFDFNHGYIFFAKAPYFLYDTNTISNAKSQWNNFSDVYFNINTSNFSNVAYSSNASGVVNTGYDPTVGLNMSPTGLHYFGFYNPRTMESFGFVPLDSNGKSANVSEQVSYQGSANEVYQRNFYSGLANYGDAFSSRTAIVAFNPWNGADDLNRISVGLHNPLSISVGSTFVNDFIPPTVITPTYTFPDFDINTATPVTCFASFSDNSRINYIDVNVVGTNISFQAPRILVNAPTFDANFTIPPSYLNAGTVDCNIIAVDVAGNTISSAASFNVTDINAPIAYAISNTPDTNAAIDPGVAVHIDANIFDSQGVSDVNQSLLYMRVMDINGGMVRDWNSVPLVLDTNFGSNQNFLHYYFDFYTDTNETVVDYYVYTQNMSGRESQSSVKHIYSLWDYTWTVSPRSFGTRTTNLGDLNTLGNILVTNTGDFPLDVTLSSDWDNKSEITYNSNNETTSGYSDTIAVNTTNKYSAVVKAKSSQRLDPLTIMVTPTNPRANPTNATVTASIFSRGAGPFLIAEWVDSNANVKVGDSNVLYSVRVTNAGRTDGNVLGVAFNVHIHWILPDSFTKVFGNLDRNLQSLSTNQAISLPIGVSIGKGASANQTIVFTVDINGDRNHAVTLTLPISVSSTSVVVTPGGGISSPGGGGGNGGGGGGGIFTTPEQVQTFFSVKEKFELIRGKDNVFLVRIKNPFKDRNLLEMSASVEGLLSKYLSLENPQIGDLAPGEEKFLRVSVVAPTYFDYGKHDLTFTINGLLSSRYSGVSGKPFTFENKVVLVIHEIDRNEALRLIGVADGRVQDVVGAGFYSLDMSKLLLDINSAFDLEEYEQTKTLVEQIQKLADTAFADKVALDALDANINSSVNDGIDVKKSQRLLTLAQLAFARGEFVKAGEVLRDAQLTYGLETKGAFNVGYFLMHNWGPVSVAIIIIYFLLFIAYLLFTRASLQRTIGMSLKEQDLLLRLIKEIQEQFFVQKKSSMVDYQTSLEHYEGRISQSVERIIEAQNALTNLFNLKSKSTKLHEERDRLVDTLRGLQMKYFNKGTIETGIFHAQQASMNKRLSEIDKNIAYSDARRTVRENSGITKYFWRVFYKVFK